jgi:hypothetical protein
MNDPARHPAAGQLCATPRLADALYAAGFRETSVSDGLIYDLSEAHPAHWDQVEAALEDVFSKTQAAARARAPVIYVLSEPALQGHSGTLEAALATAALGGMRSVAVEGARHDVQAHAVTVACPDDADRAAQAIVWLCTTATATGQVLRCSQVHVGRPPA